MISLRRFNFSNSNLVNRLNCVDPFGQYLYYFKRGFVLSCNSNLVNGNELRYFSFMELKDHKPCSRIDSKGLQRGFEQFPLCSFYLTKPICRSYRRRVSKRLKASSKPILDEAQFQRALSQLLPRFTAEELGNVMAQQDDPLVCLDLFNWASQQPRFKHDASTYHTAIKKLGAAEMYEEMDDVVNQVLAISHMDTEALFNTIIYFIHRS